MWRTRLTGNGTGVWIPTDEHFVMHYMVQLMRFMAGWLGTGDLCKISMNELALEFRKTQLETTPASRD